MLGKILYPSSVAVIGASHTPGKLGFEVLNNLLTLGFQGKVFPINPNGGEILGKKCFKTILNIKDKIDLAVIIIPAPFVAKALKECAIKKICGAVIISAGFRETGSNGEKMEKQLQSIAEKHNIKLIGPNCLGIINASINLNASFAEGMPKKGNISLVSQSGAMAVAITDWAFEKNLGFNKVISMGNKAGINENDFLEYLGKDKETSVILMYLESILDGKKFMEIARKVTKIKPVIVVKSGITKQGIKAVSSHTGSLAGSDEAIQTAFLQCGIIRANTIQDMFDLAQAFSYENPPETENTAIITNAGGPAIMATDALKGTKLKMAEFNNKTKKLLKKYLPSSASIKNPVDIIGDAFADRYHSAIETVLNDPSVSSLLVLLTPQIMTEKEKTANTIIEMDQYFPEKTILASFVGGKNVSYASSRLRNNRIPTYRYPERAIKMIDTMYRYKLWQNKKEKKTRRSILRTSYHNKLIKKIRAEKRWGMKSIPRNIAEKILKHYHIKIPAVFLAKNAEKAKSYAKNLGFPVVLKISSPHILHKTDAGGVRTSLKNEKEVEKGFYEIIKNVKQKKPKARIDGIIVQKMYEYGREVIVGMKKDPVFGPIVMFGLGGIYVEVIHDVTFRIAPFSIKEAYKMIEEVRAIKILKGIRGSAPSDIKKLAEILVNVSSISCDFPEITELDINPLLVQRRGKGAIAIDYRFLI